MSLSVTFKAYIFGDVPVEVEYTLYDEFFMNVVDKDGTWLYTMELTENDEKRFRKELEEELEEAIYSNPRFTKFYEGEL